MTTSKRICKKFTFMQHIIDDLDQYPNGALHLKRFIQLYQKTVGDSKTFSNEFVQAVSERDIGSPLRLAVIGNIKKARTGALSKWFR